ncbi:MAG: DUF1501 domain-containing protein [Acidobacteriota bacterium]|nr:DUF1501 domain-containing protein [Acidobacteriota bacterium]
MNDLRSLYRKLQVPVSRRAMLRASAGGFGFLGLAGLLAEESGLLASPPGNPLDKRPPHFKPRAKRVIFLFMHGGPSGIDILDPKERLTRDHGKPLPIERPLAFDDENPAGPLMQSPWKFRPGGQSGLPISDLFPNVRDCADDLCVIRSMVGEGVDHGAAMLQTFTGTSTFVRPSMGSWVVYGLGTENRNLPGFIMIKPALSHGGAKNWGSAFLPGAYQGTAVGHGGLYVKDVKKEPIRYLLNERYSPELARYELDMLQNINLRHRQLRRHDPELEARIQAFELAFRMQAAAPEVFEVEKESEPTRKLYGLDDPLTADFGWQCLLARRMAERGVRYIQCTHTYMPGGVGWDQHGELYAKHTDNARQVDRPIAGLLKDLKGRGLLEDTLVIWAGEFGRTPVSQNGDGRDHNPYGYSIWMAGGGVKGGFAYGATDEFGYHAVEDRMHIHDFHATMLHLLGIDHEKLTYTYGGRNFRLTDVAGVVAHKILA